MMKQVFFLRGNFFICEKFPLMNKVLFTLKNTLVSMENIEALLQNSLAFLKARQNF